MNSSSLSDAADLSNDFTNGSQNPNETCPGSGQRTFTAYQAYILTICVLGILLNAFVLAVFCLHRKSCTVAEIYLSNLAAADFLLMLFMPFWAQYAANEFTWPFGNVLCKVVNGVLHLNSSSSCFFLVAISMDRYVALVHPLSHEKLRRPRNARLGCVLVWVLALILSSPSLVYRETLINTWNVTICAMLIPDATSYTIVMLMITFVIPLVLILFFTVRILQSIRTRLIHKSARSQEKENKASVLIFSVLLAFFLCWLPFYLIRIVYLVHLAGYLEGCHFIQYFELFSQIFQHLAFFNSVLNPLLYVIVGKNFQKKVKEVFLMCRKGKGMTLSIPSSHTSRSNTELTAVNCVSHPQ